MDKFVLKDQKCPKTCAVMLALTMANQLMEEQDFLVQMIEIIDNPIVKKELTEARQTMIQLSNTLAMASARATAESMHETIGFGNDKLKSPIFRSTKGAQ